MSEDLSKRAFDGVSAWLRANSFVVDMAQMATMVSLAEHLLAQAAPEAQAEQGERDTLRALPEDTDFEVTAESEDDAEWCAGVSGPNAAAEAMHYAQQYRQDYGPEYTIVVRSFTKREVARIDAALADGETL